MDVAITAAKARTADPEVGPVVGFDASGFGDVQAAQIWREPEAPEDDPAMRILGAHGRLLDELALDVHAAASLGDLPRERVGLFVAMGMVDAPVHDLSPAVLASRNDAGRFDLAAFFAGGYRAIHPLWPLSMLNNVAVGQVAMDLDVRGDNLVLASDADSGLRALLEGARAVGEGSADAVLAAGIGERVSAASLARAALRGRLTPEIRRGEGGAAFVFEDRAAAEARGRGILGIVRGGATTFGRAAGRNAPAVETLVRAATTALEEARIAPEALECMVLCGGHTCSEDEDVRARLAAEGCAVHTPHAAIGHLGAGGPAVHLAWALRASAAGARHALILASGSHGGAGALLVEVPA